jgi:hypothetical protein
VVRGSAPVHSPIQIAHPGSTTRRSPEPPSIVNPRNLPPSKTTDHRLRPRSPPVTRYSLRPRSNPNYKEEC